MSGERETLANEYISERGDSQTRVDFLAGWDAAVRAGAVAEEPEYEWGVARTRFPSSPAYYERDREACERFIENPPINLVDRRGPWLILRRSKAGPWGPVDQEGAAQ